MSLPATIRVKLSSEAAEGISITRVVVQDLAVRELIEHMLGLTGKDEARIHELLLRGSLVSGASRFRWTGWDADPAAIRELLATLPGDDPTRAFSATRCVRAVLRGARQAIDIPRAAGARKSEVFRRIQIVRNAFNRNTQPAPHDLSVLLEIFINTPGFV